MLYKEIIRTINSLSPESIATERKARLNQLADYIQTKKDRQQPVRLNFICTHNSRRSHMAQVWTQAAAYHYEVPNTRCYSGGTSATAVFPPSSTHYNRQDLKLVRFRKVKILFMQLNQWK